MRFLIFTSLLLLAYAASAQKKSLTVTESVLKQRALSPQRTVGFSWVKNKPAYTLLSADYKALEEYTFIQDSVRVLCTVDQLNNLLPDDAKIQNLYGYEWLSSDELLVNNGSVIFTYNISSKALIIKKTGLDNAENVTYHAASNKCAYTIDNNVYVAAYSNKFYVPVTKNTDKNIVSGQAIARSEFGITEGLFWSADGTKLAFYQKDETEVHDYPLLDNSKTPGELISIKYPMAGQKSEKARVGIFDLKTKETVYFAAKNGQDNYLTNLSWTPDGNYVVVAEVNRDQDHMWLNVYNAKNGKFVKTLFEETSDKWTEPEHPAFFPEKTNNNFVWISERDGFNNLYYYDFNGSLIKKLTDHKFVVNDIHSCVNGVIYYNTTGESPLQKHLYGVDLKGNSKIITRANGTHSVSISSDGKYFHDNFSSHDTPNNDWIVDGRGKIVKKLLESEDKLGAYKIGSAEIGNLKGVDGSTLYTRLIKPSNFDASKKYPVLVYVYGGPHAQLITDSWLDGASLWMYWMAEQGYLVYTLDGRGSAERGFAFESQIHRQLGTVEIEDQLTGVDYLKSLPYLRHLKHTLHFQ